MTEPLLQVRGLRVAFAERSVVNGIDFDLFPAETFAMVGESGSGKTLTALAVMRLLPGGARCTASSLQLRQDALMQLSEQQFCRVRGRRIAFIFQDPQSSLNPVMTIGDQVAEVLRIHFRMPAQQRQARVVALLAQVELPEPERFAKRFPHQLSGGQRQRVMIAMALAGEPELLIADEPTTALDVTIQAQILALLKRLQQQMGMTLWIISHDLALVSTLADRIAVMQHGHVVEMAAAKVFFAQPQHPYSQQLVNALPDWQVCRDAVSQPQPALLRLEDVNVYYPIRKGLFKRVVGYVKAVDGVSLVVPQGQTVALVGESGCGKSSLAKALLGLIPTAGGRVLLDGCDLTLASARTRQQSRAAMQIVFQDPFAAMNPRWLVGAVIEEGMRALRPTMSAAQRAERVAALIEQVGLPADAAQRYPHEFSGGQRQRICIARALAVEPKLIICDEPTSALDVSIQAQILALLKQLQQRQGVSYLLITHNWGVVAEMADHVAVMYQGRLVEQGAVAEVLRQPRHPYTRQLLEAVPRLQL